MVRYHSVPLRLLAAGLVVVLATFAAAMAGGKRPRKAHDLAFEDINPRSETFGDTLALSDLYASDGVVLQFTASWCNYCREELPALQQLYATGGAPLVFVAADEGFGPDNILIIAERSELTAPLLYVPADQVATVSRHYPYEVLPATYFIDAKGRIRGSHEGSITMHRLTSEIEQLRGS